MSTPDSRLPQWAPRVKQHLIRRLYELDARGIHDDELIDKVGWALYARCASFLAAVEAVHGHVACPVCETPITHAARLDTLLHCPHCGWQLPWRDYLKTIQQRRLNGDIQVLAMFHGFVSRFPAARTVREKMLLIDQAIHNLHEHLERTSQQPGTRRTSAMNLIAGSDESVIAFLTHLSAARPREE
jgi:predicted RNA-binding Zn-ribbon protein involved in translation (DUF1610 family)